ncbi:hypothetical protein [Sphingobacterium griseoflavum]|uniref:Macroglobulin domain-containing protein n=1 Tax=Sphingobacterium griseoflavum TaxID=1474952 RepID=A0ABQ3HZN6_9SPHI|nr:hypothetical protein [Sphingobacterium griseoflavum]GHE43848.1 hypothetical protein GCM10017764_28960 [Sphingobacterium griseoflavum]
MHAYAQMHPSTFQRKGAYAEKIYLQLDADVYTTDQTVWFKAIVLESASHYPSQFSGVLHVELIAPNEQIVNSKRIQLSQGSGHGAFTLQKTYPAGKYLLRAYTEWNHNFGKDFIFSRYIDLFPAVVETKMAPIIDIKMLELEPNSYRLQAKLFPRLIDPAHRKHLSLHLILDGKKDSMLLKESDQGYYLLDKQLPPHTATAIIQMRTHNGIGYTKSLATPTAPIDLQFFPEGGEWLQNIPTKLGFKAVDPAGKGVAVSGTICNNVGDTISSFTSNHLGIGAVYLTANEGHTYHAVLDSTTDRNLVRAPRYALPATRSDGQRLAISRDEQQIRISIQSTEAIRDSLFVQVSCRGNLYYFIKTGSQGKQVSASIPVQSLPEGILLFTLLDRHMRPIAARIYFHERPENRLAIQAATASKHHQKRSETDLAIQVWGSDGLPTQAKLSVMAVASDHIGKKASTRQNILTHFLLQSELRGEVEEPNYYFHGDSAIRAADLDALMLTQGWRNYKYNEPMPTSFSFSPEFMPYIAGEITGVLSKKKQAGVQLSLIGFGSSNIFQVQSTDSLGSFFFQLPDQYCDTLDVLLQTASKAGKNRDYTIHLDKRHALDINYDAFQSMERIDSTIALLARKRQDRSRQEAAYRTANGGILLDEVIVERKQLSKQEQKVLDTYGEADAVISGKDIQEKEQKWSYGLYSVLLFNFPNDIRIERTEDAGGYLVAKVHGSEPTLVVVDGIPVPGHSYDIIPNFPPSEVKSFEIIRFAKNFANLYMQTYPEASPMTIPMTGHVIAIYTHAGQGVYNVRRSPGLLQISVPVYSPSVEFYAPRYTSLSAEEAAKPDFRTLLHWLPDILTDEKGTTSVAYYNGDNTGEMTIIIEAFNAAGEIGYCEYRYMVEDKTNASPTRSLPIVPDDDGQTTD